VTGRSSAVGRPAGALLLGAVVGVGAVAVHRWVVLGVPAGLLLAVAASLLTAGHLRRGPAPRSAAAYCLGWVAVVGLALAGRPEGDYAVAGDVPGYALMGTGFVLVAFGVASLAAPGRTHSGP
jgi:hypothetical protein